MTRSLLGLPLDDAQRICEAEGDMPKIRFTAAPRRVRESGDPAARPGDGYVARVIGERPGELICAWFHEPEIN